jgi:hypothetical protein
MKDLEPRGSGSYLSEFSNTKGFDRSTAVAVTLIKHLYLLHSSIQFWCNKTICHLIVSKISLYCFLFF